MVGKEEVACRQILHRARDHIRARRPRFAPSKESHERLVTGFMSACLSGDLEGLKNLLAHDVTSWADGGGKVRGAARNPVHGADAVARLFLGIMKKVPAGVVPELAEVNGWPGLVLRLNGAVVDVISFETDGAHIHAIRSVLNPDKLARI